MSQTQTPNQLLKLTDEQVKAQISRFDCDQASLLQWCFMNLHKYSSKESRSLALSKIQGVINSKIKFVPMSSLDHLIYEFFFSIYRDEDYFDTSLLNLISGIQSKLIINLFPNEWPSAFNPSEKFSVINFPEKIFYNFLTSFKSHAAVNKQIVRSMIEDEFSLNNIISRISEDAIQGNSNATISYAGCFDWADDYHILIKYPCFLFILDDFYRIPNPEYAISILSKIFQSKMDEKEKFQLISDFKLLDRFMFFLQNFSALNYDVFCKFSKLICNIFGPLSKYEAISTFLPLFITLEMRHLLVKSEFQSKFELNGLFHEMISNKFVKFSSVKDVFFPILVSNVTNPQENSDSNVSLILDLFFRNDCSKEELSAELRNFLAELMKLIDQPNDGQKAEESKYKKVAFLLSGFSLFIKNYPLKVILREVLQFFSGFIKNEPSDEDLNDGYYYELLKAYSNLFIYSSNNFQSKSFADIRVYNSLLFYRQYQCCLRGSTLFYESMLQFIKINYTSIISLGQINEIIINLITSLNEPMVRIGAKLVGYAPEEVAGMLKSNAIDMILSRDPLSFNHDEIRALFLLFGHDKLEATSEKKKKDTFSGFLFISPDVQKNFDFFCGLFPPPSEGEPNRFESKIEFFEYVQLMVFLFGYKAFPIYSSCIFSNPNNHEIHVLTNLLDFLGTKFAPNDLSPFNMSNEVEQTIAFFGSYSSHLLDFLSFIINRDSSNINNGENCSEEMNNLSAYYDAFTRFIIKYAPIAPPEIFSKILDIFERLFNYPVLSNESLEIFLKFVVEKNDFDLAEAIYMSSVQLLVKIVQQPHIYPIDFMECAIQILTFHIKIYKKDLQQGDSMIAPSFDLLESIGLRFNVYVHLLKSNKDNFPSELGKIMKSFFKEQI